MGQGLEDYSTGAIMKNIANLLFEAGMLERTPRTGLQFFGSGRQSVAEHSFRVAFIGYVLGQLEEKTDTARIIKMCLLHDLPEARTGDLNYMNKKYVHADEDKAIREVAETVPFGNDIKDTLDEFRKVETRESMLANDADQIELILLLKEHKDLGNKYADEWISYAMKRLRTTVAKELAETILDTDSTHWWFSDKSNWWVHGKKNE